MKTQWLNFVLRLTNRVYARKQALLGASGIRTIGNVAALIFLEVILSVASLPLYLTLRSAKVVAYFEQQGVYAKASFDYHLRRVLTLTGVSIVLLIWIIKLLLILLVPSVYGPLQLYRVSALHPVDLANQELSAIASEAQIQTARVVPTLAKPELQEVRKEKGGDYTFSGAGPAGMTVVLFLSGEQTAVYTEKIDTQGRWSILHSHTVFKLAEGNHSIIVLTYDEALGVRSEPAPEQFFKATTTFFDRLVRNVDTIANWSVVVLLAIGFFLTVLTI